MKVQVKQDVTVADIKGRFPGSAFATYDRKGNASKYVPHIGAKEQAKAAARAAH